MSSRYSLVRTIAFFLFVVSTISVNAQCGLEQLPYISRFDNSTQNACWLTSTGTNPAIFYFNGAQLNASAQAGPCILVSPSFYIDKPAKLNYSFHHQLNGTWGRNDSITVQIRKLPGSWVTLKAYPMGFNTLNHNVSSIWPLSEEFDLDQSYVGDTIRVRFIFNTPYSGPQGPTVSSPLIINAFRVASYSDTVYSIPFNENFDGSNWIPDVNTSFGVPVFDIHPDWWALPWPDHQLGLYKWAVRSLPTTSLNTGPPSDHSGNGNYIYTEASQRGLNAEITTPKIDISGASKPALTFAYHMYGQGIGELEIEQWVNGQWIKLDSILGERQGATDPWIFKTVQLDSTGITNVRFRSEYVRGSFSGSTIVEQDMAIDEVSIYDNACPVPNEFGLTMSSNTATSVTMDGGPAGPFTTSFVIQYGRKGFTFGSGTIDTVQSIPFTIAPLSPDLDYEVYIMSLCGAADTSVFYGPYSARTTCFPKLLPYEETFDNQSIPGCWFTDNPENDTLYSGAWKPTLNSFYFPQYGAGGKRDHTGNGGRAVGVDGSIPFVNDVSLYSPIFDVSHARKPTLEFWLFSDNVDNPGDNNRFYVDFYDGQQWVDSVITYRGDSADWIRFEYPIDPNTVNGNVQFRFVVDKDAVIPYFNDILIDDFKVYDGYFSQCALPTNLQVSFPSCGEARIAWNSDSSIVQSDIVYGPKGFDLFSSGTQLSAVTSPIILSNLTLGDSMEVYVLDSCSQGVGVRSIDFMVDSTIAPTVNFFRRYESNTDSTVTYTFAAWSDDTDSIAWDFGGGQLVYQDTILLTFDSAQAFPFSVYGWNDCGESSFSSTLVIDNINTGEISLQSNLTIYPNPSDGRFEVCVDHTRDGALLISLYNVAGDLVRQAQTEVVGSDKCTSLEWGDLPSGTYVLSIEGERGGVVREKLIVK